MAEYSYLLTGKSDVSTNLRGYLYANLTGSTSITATGKNFSYTSPLQAKGSASIYVSPDTIYPPAFVFYAISVGNLNWANYDPGVSINRDVYGTVGTVSKSYKTADYFTATNKSSRTVQISLSTDNMYFMFRPSNWGTGGTQYTSDTRTRTPITLSVTLDIPPTATLGTPTYATPHYARLGAYTVPITSAEAYYGGDVSKITLTVGSDSTTKSYASPTVTDDTISVTPSVAGFYTPTVTVEDTRGQTTTLSLEQIYVNPYLVPSLSYDVYRTNANGVKDDEGHYALLQATISYTDEIATLTEPSIQIDGTDIGDLSGASVAWYSSHTEQSGVADLITDWTTLVPQAHAVTIYGLVSWTFAEDVSYQFTLVANDSYGEHSLPITQTMSTAFYTIDFQAGGKEIAFGAPANDNLTDHPNGLFKCKMDAWFDGNVIGISGSIVGEIKTYAGVTVPSGWLECDGSEVLMTDYPLLNDALGGDSANNVPATLWGTASDADHFVIPNLMGRVPVGQDTSATPDADFDTVGETGGDKSVTLTANQSGVKSHGHGFYADFYIRHGKDSGTTWVASGSNTAYAQGAYGSQWAGGGSITSYKHHPDRIAINGGVGAATAQNAAEAHTNMQPYAVVKYIICTGE